MSAAAVPVEVCVDSVESAIAAQEGGASRIELCAELSAGGVTPGTGMISAVREKVSIPLHVMIRPRGGDFCYSDAEFNVMKNDIIESKNLGVDGIVCGILTKKNTIDVERMGEVRELASGLSITFHRAFDLVKNPLEALDVIVNAGVHRMLTSGQCPTAMEGLNNLSAFVMHAKKRIRIIAAGGINEKNVGALISRTRVQEVHVASSVTRMFEGKLPVVDAGKVRNLVRAVSDGNAAAHRIESP